MAELSGQPFATLHLMVDPMECPSCIRDIEASLKGLTGVANARVNFSTHRVAVTLNAHGRATEDIVDFLEDKGYRAVPFDPSLLTDAGDKEAKALLRALAVAGFGLANVMLLSVSVWSGLGTDMGSATRDLFHWISALIALPCVIYAIQPFLRSAISAIGHRRLNMDVPIALAVILATGLSLYRTAVHEDVVYFDAGLMLLFFLLIGRTLDRQALRRARSVAQNLVAFQALTATVVDAEDGQRSLPIDQLAVGMTVMVAPGEKIPVDGTVTIGQSDVDGSPMTGESLPLTVTPDTKVYAGTINLSGALHIKVEAVNEDTVLADIVRLMEAAEQRRGRTVRLADRAAAVYAPAVHLLAAGTFAGWLLLGDSGWQVALMNAVAVLIITCPCALGLAVPAVQVVASGCLFKRGILVKAADALERLALLDMVVFDKTGTLTLGQFQLVNGAAIAPDDLSRAASLAAASRHPLARALVRAAGSVAPPGEVREEPGQGLEATTEDGVARLGSRRWCGLAQVPSSDRDDRHSELWYAAPDRNPVRFAFADRPRPGARATVAALRGQGIAVALLSGDRLGPVGSIARDLGIDDWRAAQMPGDKICVLEGLAARGRRVLMVGDGLNDAPALAVAHASLSPTTAADISQTSADVLFQGTDLRAVSTTLATARGARSLMIQNLALAFAYNCLAVPLAIAGLITPLLAAVAMSTSSLVVTLNALRLTLLVRTDGAEDPVDVVKSPKRNRYLES